jgi:hypothetical protein
MAQEKGTTLSVDYDKVLAQFEADVQAEIDNVYRADGHVDEHGQPSDEALRRATFKRISEQCVANSKSERSRKALTKGELYVLTFPSAPTDEEANKDRVKERVMTKLASNVWGLTQSTRSGYVQRQFEAEEQTLVLCRCRVLRNGERRQAVYVTNSEALIKEDAVDPEIKVVTKRAAALRKDLQMILNRHPDLRDAITAELAIELRRISDELSLDRRSTTRQRQVAA